SFRRPARAVAGPAGLHRRGRRRRLHPRRSDVALAAGVAAPARTPGSAWSWGRPVGAGAGRSGRHRRARRGLLAALSHRAARLVLLLSGHPHSQGRLGPRALLSRRGPTAFGDRVTGLGLLLAASLQAASSGASSAQVPPALVRSTLDEVLS